MILKNLTRRKFNLRIANDFISSMYNDEENIMHLKSDNTEIMINDEADEEEPFDSFKK